MKQILFDTNAYVAFKQGHSDVVAISQHAHIIGISTIVLGELIAGFTIGTKINKNLQELNSFLNSPRVKVFSVDEETASYYAKVYATLRKKGRPIPTNDLWIAATALQHGCKLCTFDSDFKSVDNLIIAKTLPEFLL